MPHLVQILLPIYDNHGSKFAPEVYGQVRSQLTESFGGLTAYTRAPAEGLWGTGDQVKRDDIVRNPTDCGQDSDGSRTAFR